MPFSTLYMKGIYDPRDVNHHHLEKIAKVMLFIICPSCPVREIPLSLLPHSRPNHVWIVSLAFCWNLAGISVSSVEVYSLIMNVSGIGGCPVGWSCCCCAFAFLYTNGRWHVAFGLFHCQSPQYLPLHPIPRDFTCEPPSQA